MTKLNTSLILGLQPGKMSQARLLAQKRLAETSLSSTEITVFFASELQQAVSCSVPIDFRGPIFALW